MTEDLYERLIARLDDAGVEYEQLHHLPAASAEEYSQVVGSDIKDQAKTLALRRYRTRGGKDILLYTLAGDQRADMKALAPHVEAKRVRMANSDELFTATGCQFGEVPAIGSLFDLPLAIDSQLLTRPRIFFNAGRLDRSIIIDPGELCRLENPIIVDPT